MAPHPIDQLLKLIARAATDAKFCEALVSAPEATARTAGITLDEPSMDVLKSIENDLMRFGGNSQLPPNDAKGWAMGLILASISQTDKDWQISLKASARQSSARKDWSLGIKSIARRSKPHKRPNKPRRGGRGGGR